MLLEFAQQAEPSDEPAAHSPATPQPEARLPMAQKTAKGFATERAEEQVVESPEPPVPR
jgi:hypothetical protein